MSSKREYNTSYELERLLSQSIEKMRDNVTRSHALKRQITKLRRQRRQLEQVPDEVKEWFEETEGGEDEETG